MPQDNQQLVERVRANPAGRGRIRQEETIELAENGQWAAAAAKYAEAAEYTGTEGDLWPIWRDLKSAEGKELEQATADLTTFQLQWFTTWAFRAAVRQDGSVAYEQLRKRPEQEGPYDEVNLEYLDYLLDERRYDAVVQTVGELVDQYGTLPHEEARAAEARYLSGDTGGGETLETICQRHRDDGELLGDVAMFYLRIGEQDKAAQTLSAAIRAGVCFERRVEKLKTAFGLGDDLPAAASLESSVGSDNNESMVRWFADPGLLIKPSRSKSAHWFGGSTFAMPSCKGCGHPIREWFVLDIREIDGLRERLPSWSLLPLLGCVDCMVWMARHDYAVDGDELEIRLLDVQLPAIKKYSKPYGTFPEIKRKYVRLEPLPPRDVAGDEELQDDYSEVGPLVAGVPPWIEEPVAMHCPQCEDEMTYVAAMSNVESFKPRVPINNESGYQYHFACNRCRTLSVVAQWS